MRPIQGQSSRAASLGADDPRNRRANQMLTLPSQVVASPLTVDSDGRIAIGLDGSCGLADVGGKFTAVGYNGLNSDPQGPADGRSWYNRARLAPKFVAGGAVTTAWGLLYANTADSTAISNTAAETNFSLAYTIPRGYFQVGRVLKVTIAGTAVDTFAPQNITLRLKAGSVTLQALTATAVATTQTAFRATWLVVCRSIGSSGSLYTALQGARIDTTEISVSPATATVDTLTSQSLAVSAQWTTARAQASATLSLFMIEAA